MSALPNVNLHCVSKYVMNISVSKKTQHVEWDLNKTSKTVTETLTGLFLMA